MASEFEFEIRYWGATGSLAAPLSPEAVEDKVIGSLQCLLRAGALEGVPPDAGAEPLRKLLARHVPYWQRATYGGHTTCIEVRTPDDLFILDAGSGARLLGRELLRRWEREGEHARRTAHLLITHGHLDHVLALPLCAPLYDERNRFHVRGSPGLLAGLRAVFGEDAPLAGVYYPVDFSMMRGIASLQPVSAGDCWQIGTTRITALPLNHPGHCLGYKLQRGDRTIVFASDHEQPTTPDPTLCEHARGADLLYCDAQYLSAEYRGTRGIAGEPAMSRRGWGHGTVEALVDTALEAGVRRLHLGHHEPLRDDEQLAKLETFAQSRAANRGTAPCHVQLAREGLTLRI